MENKLFGTDGIRGRANTYPIIPEVALSLGKATARILNDRNDLHPRIIIGKDTRLSCYMLETAISAGVVSMGGDVLLTGPIPTPAIAFLTVSMRCDAGIVISASHNPFYDNGIKIFGSDGFKLHDDLERKIENFILTDSKTPGVEAKDLGRIKRVEDAVGRYIVFLKSSLPKGFRLDGLKIVIDCANGSTYKVAPELFYELGASMDIIGANPDGFNINHNCGALHPEIVAKRVKELDYDLGITFDGDGDRVIFVDRNGNIIDGDMIIAFLATTMARRDILKAKKVVCTVMSNMALELFLKENGIDVIRSRVGDRYVLEEMVKRGISLGGEQSGHIILLDHSTTGDGMLTSLHVLRMLMEEGKDICYLRSLYEPFPQILRNVKIKRRKPIEEIPGLSPLLKKLNGELGGKGRILIRYSGTEPLLRIMVEGEDEEKIKEMANEIAKVVEKALC